MRPLRLSACLIEEIVGTVRTCGTDRTECIIYVTAAIDGPDQASGYIHPIHAATAASTEVGGSELDRVWAELRRDHTTIVMQVHSHPSAAHHSGTDDRWPVLHRAGFRSLVLPRFGRTGLTGAHLAVYLGGGTWRGVDPDAWDEELIVEDVEGVRAHGS